MKINTDWIVTEDSNDRQQWYVMDLPGETEAEASSIVLWPDGTVETNGDHYVRGAKVSPHDIPADLLADAQAALIGHLAAEK